MIKLLAIDMDGTCLDSSSRMREVTLQALEQAVAAGICIVPTIERGI